MIIILIYRQLPYLFDIVLQKLLLKLSEVVIFELFCKGFLNSLKSLFRIPLLFINNFSCFFASWGLIAILSI